MRLVRANAPAIAIAFVDLEERADGIHVIAADGVTQIILKPGNARRRARRARHLRAWRHEDDRSLGHLVTARKLLMIGAPLIAMVTAHDRPPHRRRRSGARRHVCSGRPFGAPTPDGKTRLAWQLLTFVDDRGVKETIPLAGLSILAHARGLDAMWTGASNQDGIAEVALEMDGLEPNERARSRGAPARRARAPREGPRHLGGRRNREADLTCRRAPDRAIGIDRHRRRRRRRSPRRRLPRRRSGCARRRRSASRATASPSRSRPNQAFSRRTPRRRPATAGRRSP